MKRWRRILKFVVGSVGALALLWVGGLAWFVYASLSIKTDRASSTDAIVVLTGGRLRVETALDLLGAGRAQKLFISGVNRHVDRSELLRVDRHNAAGDDSRIDLGHDAGNTLGNARETADWMRQEGFRSLRLVTSWYHMRRSLLEFERAMPGILIVPEPVFAAHNDRDGWTDVALLTVGEYHKYLATLVRPEVAVVWPRAGEYRADGRLSSIAGRQP